MHKEVIDIIKNEIERRGVHVLKIILFGSRARSDFTEDSDWDIFVVVDGDLSFQEKQNILTKIYRRLAKMEDSYEIVIQSISKFEKNKNLIGYLSYEVDKEGVVIWKSNSR